ncbi:hypothetical protein CWI36_2151p0010, partial [Hamiltosporidium magnivora]
MNNALSMRLLALKILFLRENNLANKNRISHKEIFKLLSKRKESPGFKLIDMSSVIIYSTCFSQKEKNFRNILSILNEYAHRINDIENIHIYFFIEDITYFISLIQRDSSYEMSICSLLAQNIIIFLKKKISLNLKFTLLFFKILHKLCGKLYLDKHITDLHDDLFAISCYHITYLLDSIRFYKTYEIHPDYDLSNHIEALSQCFNIFTINNIHLSNFTEVSRLNNKFIDIVSVKALIGKWEDNICIILFEFQEKMYPEIANEIIFQKYFAINRFLEIMNTTAFENEIQKECILCEINLQMGVLNTFIINDEMNLNEKIIFRYSDGFLSTNIIKASNSDDNSFLYDLYENIEKKSVFIEVSIDIFICCLNNLNCDTRNIEIHKIFDFILKNIFCYSMVVFKLPSCLDSDYMKKFFDKLFSDDILVNIFIKTVSNEFDKIYVALGEIQRLVSIKAKENK